MPAKQVRPWRHKSAATGADTAPAKVLRVADEVSYRAKAGGRNRVEAAPTSNSAPQPAEAAGPLAPAAPAEAADG